MQRCCTPQFAVRPPYFRRSRPCPGIRRCLSSTVPRLRDSTVSKGILAKRSLKPLRCAELSGTPVIQKLSAGELEMALQDRRVPIIVDFYATWCGPCVMMSDELLKVATQLKDGVKIFKVDTDEETALSSQLNIQALPTLMFLSPDTNKKSLRVEGMLTAEDVVDIINKEL